MPEQPIRPHCGVSPCHITAPHVAHVPATDLLRGGIPLTRRPNDGHLHVGYGYATCALCDVDLRTEAPTADNLPCCWATTCVPHDNPCCHHGSPANCPPDPYGD